MCTTFVAGLLVAPVVPAAADHTAAPNAVSVPGSHNSEMGCPGDWQPDCAQAQLVLDPADGRWKGSYTLPAGTYQYKAAINGSWDENYGAGGVPGGADITYTTAGGPVSFSYDPTSHVVSVSAVGAPDLRLARAQWLRRDVLAFDVPAGAADFRLFHAPEGGLVATSEGVSGGESLPLALDPAGLPAELAGRFPHLAAYEALRVPRTAVGDLLTGQLAVAAFDGSGRLVDVTGVQIPGVLDDLYAGAAGQRLGPVWRLGRPSLALWAPTAKDVELVLGARRLPMTRDGDGVWHAKGDRGWRDARYAFAVTVYVPALDDVVTNVVTDPYSLGLTTNSARSVLVDLDDPALAPKGWDRLRKPALPRQEDSTIYELHVRDFSVGDTSVPSAHRGTFLAFTDRDSAGMRQLRDLAGAGLNTVHLLPVNDIATIEERRSQQQAPPCDLASYGPAAEDQQACLDPVRDADGFNWGYDPLHYTTPEGSYSTNPDGTRRTREFREMVGGLNGAGLRVVLDVVYNHTPASGQDEHSVLDRIVPGYYQRLSATGAVETSTCCANTATEHRMMGKLMVDSVVTWAREYKVDGFRFDLMGHHTKANMLAVRAALDRLTPEEDGVDGRKVFLYGEGWNFGEVANDARFVQATQLNMAGTGIGTFSDRLRDAVRGGGPFDEDPRIQGFATGLYTDQNGAAVNGTPEQQRARLLLYQDQIKVGLAGNLRDYRFTDRSGAVVTGSQVDYNGQPAGYAADPAETITYVDAHDNETLFDVIQYKVPRSTSMADRVRMNTVALATTALAQGPSFWHAGTDLLRSKSLDRNSYNSGDWFNRVDWTGRESTWGSGLPPRADNEPKWDFMRPLLADPALEPGQPDLRAAHRQALDLLRIRFSSPLFRLGSAREVQARVSFPAGGPDQAPGVIVMVLDDRVGPDLDPRWESIVVVFNASDEATTQPVPGQAGARYRLHPVQAGGADPVVRGSGYDRATGAFTVPARSVAVFTSR
ncbi:pullulanase-type alpha-1,6-glucosidase [Actinophytocola algeriensis]|uniref:Pullulanase-type alpha-1,6-glucosidase n=1 Tax=Actinophytocola algeriensis TaxID=1768010 RepID=A0A7W7VHW8_9PSEU|nr:pullulanase-type alpha-1,6-glucosidase [Actinophytocola algeriensis]MBB4910843.1 pullulanase-type alpha-1,6-glucosidase [Actinophytocola algeriensis]MBE1473836.1 pullulanase-type alpha-1,6-glucosidase [Actinophytocola algeriensis]